MAEARRLALRQAAAIESRRADASPTRVYRRQRASDRELVSVVVRYARDVAAVYQRAVREAVDEVLAQVPDRADARITRIGQVEASAELITVLQAALRRAVREAARRAAKVPVPVGKIEQVHGKQARQALRSERRYIAELGADPRRMAATLRIPPDRVLGVDIAPSLAEQEAMRRHASDMLDLVRSIPREQLAGYERTIAGSIRAGMRWESIARNLERREGVDARHARLIARDQTNKLNAAASEATQRAIGVDRYVWRATPDGLVRDSHAEVDGLVVGWGDPPPGTGPYGEAAHAGMAIQCRCQAEAVIPPGIRVDDDASPMPEIGSRVP